MAVASVLTLDDDLDWAPFHIPASTAGVHIAVLRLEPATGARTVVVRFPPGWARPGTGSYTAAEEFVVIEGVLEMSGHRFEPSDWAYVPRGAARHRTRTPDGALAVARFSGPTRWLAETTGTAIVRGRVECGAPEAARADPLGTGGRAWLVREGDPDSGWLVEPGSSRAPSDLDAEVVSVAVRTWAWVPAGAPAPALDAPWFCRTFAEPRGPL